MMWERLRLFAGRVTKAWTRPTWSNWGMKMSAAGEPVTEERALQASVVWACTRVVCESIAQLPWQMFRKTDQGRERATTHPADRLLSIEPNDEMSPAVFRECLIRDAQLWGNGYAEIVRDGSARPTALYLLRPDIVEPVYVPGYGVQYLIQQETGGPVVIPGLDMFHLRGMGDSLKGFSVIQYGANTIGLALAENATQSAFIRNDARPLGLLTPVGAVRPQAKTEIESKWHEMTSGANKGRTVVLPQQMQYTSLGIPNTDAQMLESRKFSTLEICRLFRVPPHKVAELQFATFSNIVHQSMEFIQDSLGPWIIKLEQEADKKLISWSLRGTLYSRINVNGLLRGDFETRTRAYQMLFDRGVFSINDILELEDRNTIGPDGDVHFVPMNMQPLERAIEEPEPPPDPAAGPAPISTTEDDVDAPDPEDDTEAAADFYYPVIADAARRILHAQKTRKRSGDSFERYVVDTLTPLAGLLEMTNTEPVEIQPWATNYAATVADLGSAANWSVDSLTQHLMHGMIPRLRVNLEDL